MTTYPNLQAPREDQDQWIQQIYPNTVVFLALSSVELGSIWMSGMRTPSLVLHRRGIGNCRLSVDAMAMALLAMVDIEVVVLDLGQASRRSWLGRLLPKKR